MADDDVLLRTAVTRVLSVSCDVVGYASDSATLFTATKTLRPQVVLLDFTLAGGLSGPEICRRLKAMVSEVSVVAFTGSDDPELEQLAYEAGASAFVSKLKSPDSLLRTIQAVIDSD